MTKKHNASKDTIVIVGGGLSGLACAATLTSLLENDQYQIIIIDKDDPKKFREMEFDGRASALVNFSQKLLEKIGLWDTIAKHSEQVKRIEVADGYPGDNNNPILLRFDEITLANNNTHIIANKNLYAAFYDYINKQKNITIIAKKEINKLRDDSNSINVIMEDGHEINAKIVIGADGRNSKLRNILAIETIGWTYNQVAIVTTVSHENSHNGVAVEKFMPEGPFAILPLPNNQSSLVWTEFPISAKKLMEAEENIFIAQIKRRMRSGYGDIERIAPKFSYPLGMHIAKNFVSNRIALIGDAAHIIHPLAGLGFNLALRDIASLAEIILKKAEYKLDIGTKEVTEEYQLQRRFDTVKNAMMMESMNLLFANDNTILRKTRGFGLSLVDNCMPIKQFFVKHASGLTDNIPNFMK